MAKRKQQTEDGPGREPFPASDVQGSPDGSRELAPDTEPDPPEYHADMGDGPVEPDTDGINMSAGNGGSESEQRSDKVRSLPRAGARVSSGQPRSVYLVIGIRGGSDSPDVLSVEKSYRRAHAWTVDNAGLISRFYGTLKIMRAREVV